MAETQTDQSQPVTHRQISSDEHTPTSSASPHDPSTAGPPLGDTLPALDATPARLDAGESVPDAPLPSSPSGSSASASPSSPAHASTSAGAEASGSTPQRTQRSPQNNSPSGVAGGSSSPQGSPSQSSPQGSPSQGSARRVKLYRLQDVEWLDLGTGNCVGHFVDGPPTTISISPRQSVTLDEGAWILVTREAEDGNEPEMILKSKIRPYPPGYLSDDEGDDDGDEVREGRVLDTGGYLKQQETLIVWTEDDTEHEMALSFATVGGCAEIWEFIKAARKWSNPPLTSPSLSPSLSSPQHFPLYSLASAKLPEPTLGNIEQVEHAIRSLGRTAIGRERTASAITAGGFVQKLIKIHEEAEDLESLDDLHALCRVMQTILLLNDNVIFDLVLHDEIILGVASILEYDPEFPSMKASYRDHLADPSHFTQVVPIRSPTLLAKIHQTHRLHYLKDVVLARILEDSTFSMLNSAIYFNEVDIVNEVSADAAFLRELFAIFDDEDADSVPTTSLASTIGPQLPSSNGPTPSIGPQLPPHLEQQLASSHDAGVHPNFTDISPPAPGTFFTGDTSPSPCPLPFPSISTVSDSPNLKHDAILFLQQFATMAKNLQIPARAAFFRNLADKGLLRVIEVALSHSITEEDTVMRSATIEILMALVDHDPTNVRAYSLKQHAKGKRPLVVFLIEMFHNELDLGLKQQMSEALRVLVDAGGDGGPLEAPPRLRQEDPEAEKFLQYFYDHCILSLLAPVMNLPEVNATDSLLDLPPTEVALCCHLCDLLCFFVLHHTFRSKYFVLSTTVSTHVSKLLTARPKHLRLAAIRFFRACVHKTDDFYNRFLIKNELVAPILDIALGENGKDNLVTSACLEFFEFVRTSNAKAIINHVVERYGERTRQLAKLHKTFENLLLKYEQNNEPPPPKPDVAISATSKSMTRERGSWTRMDMEEENYFDNSDEETDDPTTTVRSVSGPSTVSKKREGEGSGEEEERKRMRVEGEEGEGGIRRSKTWPMLSDKGKEKGLVEYGEDEDAGAGEEGHVEVGEEGEGGFVREGGVGRRGEGEREKEEEKVKDPKPPESSPMVADALPEFKLGEMRKRDLDDDDQLGLLFNGKNKKVAVVSKPTAGMAKNAGGGIKISFGVKSGNLARLAEGQEEKGEEGEKGEK